MVYYDTQYSHFALLFYAVSNRSFHVESAWLTQHSLLEAHSEMSFIFEYGEITSVYSALLQLFYAKNLLGHRFATFYRPHKSLSL